MLINTIDISNFGAKQLKVDIQTSQLDNESEWLNKTLSPIFLENKIKFKDIKVELIFKGDSRDIILKNISNLMSKLTKEVDLKLDGYSNRYKCILTGNETVKTTSKKAYKKNLEFVGYEYSDELTETMNRITTKTINVLGNTKTPCIVEITPSVSIIDIVITGVSDGPMTIRNLTGGKKVVIDGEEGIVTVDGANKFDDTDMWEFPRLKAGSNTITVTRNNVDILIKYKPRFI